MHEIYNNGVADEIPCYFRDWTRSATRTLRNDEWAGLNLDEEKK